MYGEENEMRENNNNEKKNNSKKTEDTDKILREQKRV
jgi:hypothetical protein